MSALNRQFAFDTMVRKLREQSCLSNAGPYDECQYYQDEKGTVRCAVGWLLPKPENLQVDVEMIEGKTPESEGFLEYIRPEFFTEGEEEQLDPQFLSRAQEVLHDNMTFTGWDRDEFEANVEQFAKDWGLVCPTT